jgi:hypothetical protein
MNLHQTLSCACALIALAAFGFGEIVGEKNWDSARFTGIAVLARIARTSLVSPPDCR